MDRDLRPIPARLAPALSDKPLSPGRGAAGPKARRAKRHPLHLLSIDMLSDHPHILDVAKRLKDHVEAPVLGGIAVHLHGYLRTTCDLDFYTPDRSITDVQLRAAGATWDKAKREHLFDGVRIHTVTPEDAGHVVRKTSIIQGVRVVSLADLIAIKLLCGLKYFSRTKDIADVQELIKAVPLDKSFAPKLPKNLRREYTKLVANVGKDERKTKGGPQF